MEVVVSFRFTADVCVRIFSLYIGMPRGIDKAPPIRTISTILYLWKTENTLCLQRSKIICFGHDLVALSNTMILEQYESAIHSTSKLIWSRFSLM